MNALLSILLFPLKLLREDIRLVVTCLVGLLLFFWYWITFKALEMVFLGKYLQFFAGPVFWTVFIIIVVINTPKLIRVYKAN